MKKHTGACAVYKSERGDSNSTFWANFHTKKVSQFYLHCFGSAR